MAPARGAIPSPTRYTYLRIISKGIPHTPQAGRLGTSGRPQLGHVGRIGECWLKACGACCGKALYASVGWE